MEISQEAHFDRFTIIIIIHINILLYGNSVVMELQYLVPDFCSKIRAMFDAVKPLFQSLKSVVPLNDYYR